MNCINLYTIQKYIPVVIIGINVLSVRSDLELLQNVDPPSAWSQDMFATFNNEFAILIDKEYTKDPISCDEKNKKIIEVFESDSSIQNRCPGTIHTCWMKTKENSRFRDFGDDMCFCLCNHTYDNNVAVNDMNLSPILRYIFNYPTPKLLDSFCLDPISVNDNYVITGVRFKRYDNRIHLEVQKGKLINGMIYSRTVMWQTQQKCVNSKKIFSRNSDSTYDRLKIVLTDLTLPENAVVTGVTFGESIVGRYLNDDGSIHRRKLPIVQKIDCNSTNNILKNFTDIRPSTALIGNNTELSHSCKDHFFFNTTSFDYDFQQHIVPYVDLREIVTDPPEAIRGIGWYYHGAPNYGGFLSLRIFTKKYFY